MGWGKFGGVGSERKVGEKRMGQACFAPVDECRRSSGASKKVSKVGVAVVELQAEFEFPPASALGGQGQSEFAFVGVARKEIVESLGEELLEADWVAGWNAEGFERRFD
jgi:hypothetical protein